LHDLRHGAATLMLLEGASLKTIADQLGHSSVVLTADTYLSVSVELGLKTAPTRPAWCLRQARDRPVEATSEDAAPPCSSKSPSDPSGTLGTRRRWCVAPPCPNDPRTRTTPTRRDSRAFGMLPSRNESGTARMLIPHWTHHGPTESQKERPAV
jgi:hypothetical protein